MMRVRILLSAQKGETVLRQRLAEERLHTLQQAEQARWTAAERLVTLLDERLGLRADVRQVILTPDDFPLDYQQRAKPCVTIEGVCFFRWNDYFAGENLSVLRPCELCVNWVGDSWPGDIKSIADLYRELHPWSEHERRCHSCYWHKPKRRMRRRQPLVEPALLTRPEIVARQMAEWDHDFLEASSRG